MNIIVLNIEFKFAHIEDTIHPVILQDDKEMILVDCGYTGFMPMIEEAMAAENLDCNQLTKIIITHHDHDHMGALADFKKKYPQIRVVASEIEAPYIEGKKKSLRLEQAEALQHTLSHEEKPFGEAFCKVLRAVEPVKVDQVVKDGEAMDWCGGCVVISTPGHTPGHLSIYLKEEKTIITGDAAVLENNELVIANPKFTMDIEQAHKSMSKILDYDANTYICYHGGIFKR
ncbi:MBL fold metallo-hydrolase [Alkaliphilus oremlandii]|uniref:Beta-lactamase domain protein n=1 Tax=Alkaliphilus oremlandii (strain OhILAs) TaxID=350688 RepID=A8MLA0_ALKOO|nr:MBL fold metallo-hydrolase [Alkaliphilus oremlandii]ABW17917.1 beta-lactamase domain protein [Alkaliphilus oremlandii OhILAs]